MKNYFQVRGSKIFLKMYLLHTFLFYENVLWDTQNFVECTVKIRIKTHLHSETRPQCPGTSRQHARPSYLSHSGPASSRWVQRIGQTSCEDRCSPVSRHHSLLSSRYNCCNLKLGTKGNFLLWNQLHVGVALKQHKSCFAQRKIVIMQFHRVKQNSQRKRLFEIMGLLNTQAGILWTSTLYLEVYNLNMSQ